MAVTATWTPADFNVHDVDFLKNPYPTFAKFRESAPVWKIERRIPAHPYETSHWVFRYDDVRRILTDPATFQKHPPGGDPPMPGPFFVLQNLPFGIFFADPPAHTRIRGAIEPVFRNEIRGAPAIAAKIAGDCIAAVHGLDRFELVANFSLPVPSSVAFSVLGIPAGDKQQVWRGLVSWVTAILLGNDPTQSFNMQMAAATSAMALKSFFQALILGARKNGQAAGVLGTLVRTIDASDGLTAEELQESLFNFAVAGYLSTTFLIGTGLLNLLNTPGELDKVRRDPSLMPKAVEEMLRIDPPILLADRYCWKDTLVGGMPVKAGEKVTAVLGSANHDETVFPEPDRFLIGRTADHMSFGAGIHDCIGAPLARITAPIALSALLEAFPKLRVDGLPQWCTDPYLRYVANLPLAIA